MLKKLRFLIVSAVLLLSTAAWGESFIAHNDGTLTDPITGVEWADDASTPTVNSCTGGTQTWEQAQAYIACLNEHDYLGNNDWRLPTAHEFGALVGNLDKATGVQNKAYWTGSEFGRDGKDAYSYNLSSGTSAKVAKTHKLAVVPVRDAASILEVPRLPGQSSRTLIAAVAPRYSVTVNVGANGKVSPGSRTNIKSGAKKTFTVAPHKGFVVKSIAVDGVAQDLAGRDLTRPIKVHLIVDRDMIIDTAFSNAPKFANFPTDLTSGDYQLDLSYCLNVPVELGQSGCSGPYSTVIPFDASNATDFIDQFNNTFDQTFNQLFSGCKSKSSCSNFDGTSFECKMAVTCNLVIFSVSYNIDAVVTRK